MQLQLNALTEKTFHLFSSKENGLVGWFNARWMNRWICIHIIWIHQKRILVQSAEEKIPPPGMNGKESKTGSMLHAEYFAYTQERK